MPKKLAVYIGRFSPAHIGHREILQFGLTNFDWLLVLVGSMDQSRRMRNPFTLGERVNMVGGIVEELNGLAKTSIRGIRDYPYNDPLWNAQVMEKVNSEITSLGWDKDDTEVSLIGADRDETTSYLNRFSKYKLALREENKNVSLALSATAVREIYIGNTWDSRLLTDRDCDILLKAFLPPSTQRFLDDFKKTEMFESLREEFDVLRKQKAPYAGLKHPYNYVTTDAVVIQNGYILLVERGSYPGKGLIALPGGHAEHNLKLYDNVIKELKEETKIKLPEPVIRGSFREEKIFDDVHRSDRGRTYTVAYLHVLPNYEQDGKILLPKVRGGDDAKKAFWAELADVQSDPTVFFEDHYHIIETMVARI